MKQQVINPVEGIYPATPDYVHAIELSAMQRLLLVSGTMGLDAEGQAAATLSEQLTLIWSNIRRILAEAGMTLDNVVRVTSYLTDAAFASENQKARIAALGSRRVPTTAIVVGTLSADWLVEIEVMAAA
jgi:2-iminobutanoate/2-iminopropanoate deaminase